MSHTKDPHQKARLFFLLLQGSVAIFSTPYSETGWTADLLQVYDDSSISAIPWSPAFLWTDMRVANKMSWLTQENTLLQYRLHLLSMTQACQMSNDGRRSSPCCPLPTASTGRRKWLLCTVTLSVAPKRATATVMFQSNPEQVLVG